MGEVTVHKSGYRSLFWPILLIAVGVIWLLGNLGIISGANIAVLFRLWPLLLIIIGLDLLFGRQSPAIGALIGIGAVVLIIALMIVGPSVGLGASNIETTLDTFSEPRGDVASADINLDFSVGEVTMQALTDSSDLFSAEVSHAGELDFRSDGSETRKSIYLGQQEANFGVFQGLDFLGAAFNVGEDLYWNIGLSDDVPLNLNINSGVGNSSFDFSQLQLSGLDINVGVGNINLRLPAAENTYNIALNGGVGEVIIAIPENADINLNINAGVGNFTIDIPDGAAVRLDSSEGLGNVHVTGALEQAGSDDIWQTASYSEADRRITIEFDGGIGNLTVQ